MKFIFCFLAIYPSMIFSCQKCLDEISNSQNDVLKIIVEYDQTMKRFDNPDEHAYWLGVYNGLQYSIEKIVNNHNHLKR